MKNTIMAVALTIGCAAGGFAQSTTTTAAGQASNEVSASANQAGRSINLQSGTQLQGELQKTIDASKAKVGDQVLLKTKKAIKSEGQTIVPKGARLLGHVTEVHKKSEANNSSSIGIVFDRLENGSLAVPIMATITSITRGTQAPKPTTISSGPMPVDPWAPEPLPNVRLHLVGDWSEESQILLGE